MAARRDKVAFAALVEVVEFPELPAEGEEDEVLEPKGVVEDEPGRDNLEQARVHAVGLPWIDELRAGGVAVLRDEEEQIGVLEPVAP